MKFLEVPGRAGGSLSRGLAILLVMPALIPVAARAGEPKAMEISLARLAADEAAQEAATAMPAKGEDVTTAPAPLATREEIACPEESERKLPISVGVSYYLMSDYIFRGINFSEYPGEGREKLNHQMTTAFTYDAGRWGQFGFDTFFEWYADQEKLNPFGGGQNLQEVDYALRWTYPFEAIATDLTLGYTFYTFRNLGKLLRQDGAVGNNNDNRTHEWWFRLNHNDAWAWKWLLPDNENGILNPYFLLAQDLGVGAGAVWMELGVNHPFTIPGVDNLTITPSYTITADCGYLRRLRGLPHHDYLRLAYEQWGLNVTYDLTPVLRLPKWAGTVSISGLLYFNNALGTAAHDGTINDEFWGGMALNWGWGG